MRSSRHLFHRLPVRWSHQVFFFGQVVLVFALSCGESGNEKSVPSSPAPTPAPPTSPAPTTAAQDFYVSPQGNDSGDGSTQNPWGTIQHAADTVGAGAVVHILAGTYNTANVSAGNGGSFANGSCVSRVRFVGDYNLATRTWNSKIVSADPKVWESTANCVDIEGLDLSSSNAGSSATGVKLSGRGDRLISSHVHNVANGSCVLGGGQADYLEIRGNWVHRCGTPDHSNNMDHGIYVGQNNIRVVDNIIYDASAYCITFYATNPGIPSYATISNNTMWNCKYGIGVNADAGGANYNVITNNILLDLNYGISLQNNGPNNVVANNLVWNVSGPRYEGSFSNSGDINANPLFVNWAADGSGDYRLSADSPALATGTTTGAPSVDWLNNPSQSSTAINLGAFHSAN